MNPTEHLFLLFSSGLVVAGLGMVGTAVRAYAKTEQRVMIHLSVGFALVVAATIATAMGAIFTDFRNARTLLLVNNGFSMVGYAFVIYSVASFR